MPLISGKSDLKSALQAIYEDTKQSVSASELAEKKAKAIKAFVLTAMPMTIITTLPGSVAAAQTAGPVQGMGIGGFDKPVPGMSLDAAHPLLKTELELVYAASGASASEKADKEATAIFNYFSQAIVMTQDKTDSALPAPPPAGPVTGTIKGKGGVGGSSSQGSGYDSALSDLQTALTNIASAVSQKESTSEKAQKMADAIHAFCKQAKIETQGQFVAPAVVAPPPAPPAGAYLPGVGASTSSSIA